MPTTYQPNYLPQPSMGGGQPPPVLPTTAQAPTQPLTPVPNPALMQQQQQAAALRMPSRPPPVRGVPSQRPMPPPGAVSVADRAMSPRGGQPEPQPERRRGGGGGGARVPLTLGQRIQSNQGIF